MPHELSSNQVHETLDLLHNPEYAAKAVELQLSKELCTEVALVDVILVNLALKERDSSAPE